MSNVRSVLNKLGELEFFLSTVNSDLVVSHIMFSVKKDRMSRGGGVCLLIKRFQALKSTK